MLRSLFWILVLVLIFALALPGCTTPGDATTETDGSMRVTISASRVTNCKANGGCGLYSQSELRKMLTDAIEAYERNRPACPAPNKVYL